MSIAFLAPAGLALLGALVVPILLHLARRRRAQPTTFAALRWLAPGAPPRSRVRLEEIPLLLVRLLLVALLALWLAQPVWRDAPGRHGAFVAVVPGARASIPDGADAVWLAPGFPAYDASRAPTPDQPVASLLRELDAALAPDATLAVVVPAELGGLDAQRIVLSRAVEWRVVPGSTPAPAAPSRAPELLAVRHGAGTAGLVKHFAAAVAAWNVAEPDRYRLDAQPWGAPLDAATTWLVGIDGAPDDATRRWIEAGGIALLDADPREATKATERVDATVPLRMKRRPFGSGKIVVPSSPLRSGRAELLDASFPARLRRWLEGPAPTPDRARAEAVAPLKGDTLATPPARPLAPWLALAIALVFAVERFMASGPRLARAA